jgi:predicted acylesterase/phospholipase RssA
MSILIIQKSDLSRPKRKAKIALVLAAGAVSGGAFKLGGLIALDRFLVNRKVTDFDLYVGVSAGGLIGAFLAGGIPPEELLQALDGTSTRMPQFKFYDFYWPAMREFARRAGRLARDAAVVWPSIARGLAHHLSGSREQVIRGLREALADPSYTSFERVIGPLVAEVMRQTPLPNAGRYIPSGIFDNARIERYVRQAFADNGLPNDFRMLRRATGRSLYITATNLNTGRGVVFGHDADHTVTISEAIQASTAIPGFYVPPRIRNEEYLDGSVRKTANTSLAVYKGADLIIAYNPFRPYMNRMRYQLGPTSSSLSDQGLPTILNQTIRMMLQTRLYLGVERLRQDPSFKGDLILIEPTETDAEFFAMNPLAYWNRGEAARHGFVSVRKALEQNFPEVQRVLEGYGLECDLAGLAGDLGVAAPSAPAPSPRVTEEARPAGKAVLRLVR